MKTNKLIWIVCFIGAMILMGSAIIDSALWILTGYLVPSWTISIMSVFSGVLLLVIRRLVKHGKVS